MNFAPSISVSLNDNLNSFYFVNVKNFLVKYLSNQELEIEGYSQTYFLVYIYHFVQENLFNFVPLAFKCLYIVYSASNFANILIDCILAF